MAEITFADYDFLVELGLDRVNLGCFDGSWSGNGDELLAINPANGKVIAKVKQATVDELKSSISKTDEANLVWRNTPAPIRGEVVRQIGQAVRAKKQALGKLVSLQMGKILSEGLGEVQEFIDICDYAVGLSRMFEGRVLPSERPDHTILEVWNPLGTIAVITAFNFPCAVLGWNAAIALVCGDTIVWKGASSTSLVSIAMTKIIAQVFVDNGLPPSILTMVVGPGGTVGEELMKDPRIKLVSFTGSTHIGRHVSNIVNGRFARTILELGGNNAVIIMDDADVELALRACVFAAVGTAGQRCTSLRRLIVHESLYDTVRDRMAATYANIRIGDPLDSENLMGPLHTPSAVREYLEGIETIKSQGGRIVYGGEALTDKPGFFVKPTLVEIEHDKPIVSQELFVPILYLIKFRTLDEAIAINNEVPQGLSSGLFTNNVKNAWRWVGPNGSDCGLVNVNMGPSGAEIGGAFGGEKETGGGRESGSDSWKQYMRRSTCAINYSSQLPLAQGVKFEI